MGLSIGDVAKQAGLATSAVRFYEKAGLLPAPPRVAGRRQYDSRISGRLRIILLARDAGFTVDETRSFLNGYSSDPTPARRWRSMAERKMAELDALMARLGEMKAILETSFRCDCRTLDDCERMATAATTCETGVAPRRVTSSKGSVQRLLAKR
jgi:DNA-binding transcriptional MerR regulator